MKPILTKTGSLPNLPVAGAPGRLYCTGMALPGKSHYLPESHPWCGTHFQQRSHSV